MAREAITTAPSGLTHGPGMSIGVKAGGFIFLSPIRGNPAGRQEYTDDTAAQAQVAFQKLKDTLAAFNATIDHVVKVTVYIQELEYRVAFHEVWMEFFPIDPPARTIVVVKDTNVMPGPNCHFCLDVIAVAP